jgi:hypothetical protein
MTSTLTAISTVLGADGATRARPANARLAPGGQERGGEHDARVAQKAQTGEAARWQRILDLLDPGKRCGVVPGPLRGPPRGLFPRPSRRARAAFRRRNRLALVRRKVLKAIPHGSSNTRGTRVSHVISVPVEPVHSRRRSAPISRSPCRPMSARTGQSARGRPLASRCSRARRFGDPALGRIVQGYASQAAVVPLRLATHQLAP